MTGIEAQAKGFATEAVPAVELEERTMNLALRIAKIPSDLLAFNKKSVHRAFEAQGMRTNLRNGVDLEALMFKAPGAKMLTVRRGPQKGVAPGQRVPAPRPMVVPSGPAAVAAQAVSAQSSQASDNKPKIGPKSTESIETSKPMEVNTAPKIVGKQPVEVVATATVPIPKLNIPAKPDYFGKTDCKANSNNSVKANSNNNSIKTNSNNNAIKTNCPNNNNCCKATAYKTNQ